MLRKFLRQVMGGVPPAAAGSSARWIRVAGAVLAGVGLVSVATLVRAVLGRLFPDLDAFGPYYPAVLVAGLLGGGAPAAAALLAAAACGLFLFVGVSGGPGHDPASAAADTIIFLVSGAMVAVVGARLRWLLHRRRVGLARLAERELRYRTLFESVSDGFALVEAIRDEAGQLVDYTILEANPAILRILGADASIVGRRQSEILRNPTPAWLQACDAALRGRPVTFDFHTPGLARWFEIHLSRVGDDQLAQFIVDVTDRKVAESRQAELFDELNHRVKNNLALVSAMLGMQARAADTPKVREDLDKAIDRIQTIADVHAALYRTSSKDEVDFAAYLQDLCDRLAASLLADDRIRIEVAAEPAALPHDKAVSLGVVVNELVTNAAKHAFPADGEGCIRVVLGHEGGLVLSISDNGVGMPAENGAGKAGGKGLGMRLVRSLVQQLDGQLQVERAGGSTFTIRLREPGILPLRESAQNRLL